MYNLAQLAQAPYEEQQKFLSKLSIQDLAKAQLKTKARLDELKNEKSAYQKLFDLIRLRAIPDIMADSDTTSITIEGVGRLTLTADLYARMIDKEKGFAWLNANGHGDIIKPTCNASSLKALLKELLLQGQRVPDCFRCDPFSRASITKTNGGK